MADRTAPKRLAMSTLGNSASRPRIGLQDPVSTALATSVAVVNVFVRRRMACPGCAMAPFMTLAEAATAYRIDPQMLLAEVQAAVQDTERPSSGVLRQTDG
jgi:hybrid cluster-associated redox disulfide protein